MKALGAISRRCWQTIKLMLYGWVFMGMQAAIARSSDNPFPSIDIEDGNVINAVGSQMERSMKYALIGGGIIMILVGIGVIIHRLREDSTNRDSGSFLTTLIISGLAITVGFILIAIGWTATNYHPS